MEASSLIMTLLKAYWWFIPLLMLSNFFSSSLGKGLIGEWRVRLLLRQSLDKKLYYRLHDVTLPTKTGSIQIDHLLLSPFGIFVIETKHMSGWIFGHPDQKQWTQKLNKKNFRFQNPLYQNYEHAKKVESLLGFSGDTVHSVVCFIGNPRFKTPMPDNVTSRDTLLDYIRSYSARLLTDEEVSDIYKAIHKNRLEPTWENHFNHVAPIKLQHEVSDNWPCPECGSRLVLRPKQSKEEKHQLWGCSSFPECRLTQRKY